MGKMSKKFEAAIDAFPEVYMKRVNKLGIKSFDQHARDNIPRFVDEFVRRIETNATKEELCNIEYYSVMALLFLYRTGLECSKENRLFWYAHIMEFCMLKREVNRMTHIGIILAFFVPFSFTYIYMSLYFR